MVEVNGVSIEQWCERLPVLNDILAYKEVFWLNTPTLKSADALATCSLKEKDCADAALRLERFRSFIALAFPETLSAGGLIESPLVPIPTMQRVLESNMGVELPGKLLLKCDNSLPISGSVKARGGIYEVLKYAETLALKHNLLELNDDYSKLASSELRSFFGNYGIAVGSTGNLGLSIGIIGSSFGFKVSVHMSSDARSWKKNLLREHGVNVVEHDSDYSRAVSAGREQAQNDESVYFIDDENSTDLFLGYSVAAERLQVQLLEQNIKVDSEHPLFVYLPCGVGGAPGGISFGLKHVFGDDVHCFFAEPTHSPCMLLGLSTGLHAEVSVEDFGLNNVTDADGLAVGRPSGFIGEIVASLIDGAFTVDDSKMYQMLALLADSEGLRMEPSALAGMDGMVRVLDSNSYLSNQAILDKVDSSTHIVWATGGEMVPPEEMDKYYQKGKKLI